MFYSNCRSISYRFRDFPLRIFYARAQGVLLKLCNVGGARETRMMSRQNVKKCNEMSIRLDDIIPALERRTELVQYRVLHLWHADAR